ncbi:MAG: hypothetical protein E6R08_10190 [Nevskiaceae bacterium]|nr:MAG: hypothetical protein E6R08_10190 [Nevskiaceae bacterium]
MKNDSPSSPLKLAVNEQRLVQSLKATFSDRYSVVRELAQNGRRAGATRIEIDYDLKTGVLEVRDDGAGIADFRDFLTIAKSGWDEETVSREQPYGLGTLIAFATAKHVTIESRGKRLSAPSSQILSFEALSLEDCPSAATGTVVTLTGIENLSMPGLEGCFEGYPIPVMINGMLVERPDADGPAFVDTPIGRVRLGDVRSTSVRLFLQGHEVESPRWSAMERTVVHLDPRLFRARAPDRTSLVDSDEQRAMIDTTLKALRVEALKALLRDGSPESIVDFWEAFIGHGLADALNGLDFVPGGVVLRPSLGRFSCVDGDGEGEPLFGHKTKVVTREALASLPLLAPDFNGPGFKPADLINRECGLIAVAAAVVVVERLPEGHWLKQLANFDEAREVVLTPINVRPQVFAPSSERGSVKMQFCDSVSVQVAGREGVSDAVVAITVDTPRRWTVLVSRKAPSMGVLCLFNSFEDDSDDYREEWAERAETEYDHWHLVSFGGNVAEMIRQILARNGGLVDALPFLNGRSFTVKVATEGGHPSLAVEEVAVAA